MLNVSLENALGLPAEEKETTEAKITVEGKVSIEKKVISAEGGKKTT